MWRDIEPNAFQIVERVEAQTPWRARRVQKVVAPLPGPQQLRAHAGAPAQLADPKRRVFAHGPDNTGSVQNLDKVVLPRYLAAHTCTIAIQEVDG